MDRVRLGRVLGAGVRHAARTAIEASKAAAAPDPTPSIQPPQRSSPGSARVQQAARQAGHGFFGNLKHAGRSVWLQVMGTLFGFFALYFIQAVFTHLAFYRAGGQQRQQWFLSLFMAALFTWFTVSSFVRAARKAR